MIVKRSAETQLRYEKSKTRDALRKLADAESRALKLAENLRTLRSAGSRCSNICYNLGHRESIPEHERETCLRALAEWDAKVKRLLCENRSSEL